MPRQKPSAERAREASKRHPTAKDFQAELQQLAAQAGNDTWSSHVLRQAKIYLQAVFIIGLLAVYAHVSQLALSPVFGSIPSSLWHSKILMAGCFVGWAGNLALERVLPMTMAQALPLLAIYVPTVQFFLCRFTSVLGPEWGPVIVESCTLLPLAVCTSSYVASLLEHAQLTALPSFVAEAAPGVASWGTLRLFESLAKRQLAAVVGKTFLLTRLGLEMLLAASYTAFAPSKYLIYALPALLHTAVLNTHAPSSVATARLSETLLADGWKLLDRRESVTGYVSVVESLNDGYRVMRCDHSLLGGLWVQSLGKGKVPEPIYGVFAMLEAVRLVEVEQPVADVDAHALVVGLGIGVTPSAFVAHGIDTTVVEIDPAVHDYAVKYFGYQENNPPVLEDAVSYTSRVVGESNQTFDYIVHDVFTGGAEPLDLFTNEFLQTLHDLLKPEGVIAINYAGDFNLPTSRIIVRTITQVFPTCRMFRESPVNETIIAQSGGDFTNMVIFCRKTESPMTFRAPATADFLQTYARVMFLEPKHEVLQSELLSEADDGILRKNETAKLAKWHVPSAIGHWKLMREVIPDKIWELW